MEGLGKEQKHERVRVLLVLLLSETNVLSCLDSKGSPNGYEKD